MEISIHKLVLHTIILIFSSNTTNVVGITIYSHIFTIPGTYNYDCSVGMHAAMGMTGNVIVNNTFPEITSICKFSSHARKYLQLILLVKI